jgi:hypothetical protein
MNLDRQNGDKYNPLFLQFPTMLHFAELFKNISTNLVDPKLQKESGGLQLRLHNPNISMKML